MAKTTIEKIIYILISGLISVGGITFFTNALGIATKAEVIKLETATEEALKEQVQARKTEIKEAIEIHEEKEQLKYEAILDKFDGVNKQLDKIDSKMDKYFHYKPRE